MIGMRALAAAFFCALAASTAVSQDYPNKPITLIVPFPENVGGDPLARPFAEKLAAGLGQPINVQNVPGKSGSVGVAQGAKAPPDGYTLVFSGDAALTTNAIIFEAIGYDPRQDLAPVAQLIATQNAIIVPTSSAARSLADLLKAAKDKAGQSYTHAGTGFSSHVAGEIIKRHANLDLKATAHTAPPELFKAIDDGTVLFGITGVGAAISRIKEGKFRAIVVTGPQRSPLLPEAPTLSEAGVGGHDASAWFALLAPKGTPEPIIAKLNAAAVKAVSDPDMVARLAPIGGRPATSSAGELTQRIAGTISTLSDVLKDVPKQK